ncbi:MAG: glycosyltransferase family 2 protein, partial [Lachnospiraceae bacterium]|nr:glycosyltransferase family 2 protein [Lachnospiraceae bacterium]
MAAKVTAIIPNLNGVKYLPKCLDSLIDQIQDLAQIMVIDNGSTDSSVNIMKSRYPHIRLVQMGENTGFCHAVNVGIRMAETPYVILLNNDTEVKPGFARALVEVMERPGNEDVFSVSARMLDMWQPELMDGAGDRFSALGWAFARGKGQKAEKYDKPAEIFSACGGAAIYRRQVFAKIGLFDELHFAYLEDVD